MIGYSGCLDQLPQPQLSLVQIAKIGNQDNEETSLHLPSDTNSQELTNQDYVTCQSLDNFWYVLQLTPQKKNSRELTNQD
jgi:hypothetical protein